MADASSVALPVRVTETRTLAIPGAPEVQVTEFRIGWYEKPRASATGGSPAFLSFVRAEQVAGPERALSICWSTSWLAVAIVVFRLLTLSELISDGIKPVATIASRNSATTISMRVKPPSSAASRNRGAAERLLRDG